MARGSAVTDAITKLIEAADDIAERGVTASATMHHRLATAIAPAAIRAAEREACLRDIDAVAFEGRAAFGEMWAIDRIRIRIRARAAMDAKKERGA